MASSGTVGATQYKASDLADSIARRCGVEPSEISSEGLDVISGVMWRTLASWSSRGVNLWRIYHSLYGIYNGQQVYQLAQGDIDVQRMVYRTPVRLSPSAVVSSNGGTTANLSDGDLTTACTQGGTNGSLVFDWGAGATQQVALVGINSLPARTYNLVFEISNDNFVSDITQVLAPGAVAYIANGWQWYEIDPAGIPARYFRIRETGGAVISFNEVSLAQNWSDVEIARWSLDEWSLNPNKRQAGTPRQYYFDRQITPIASLWPTVGSIDRLNLVVMWIERHIEDVGDLSNTINIPERWYQPFIDVCSYIALPEVPKADLQRFPILQEIAMAVSLPDAEKGERDSAPIRLDLGLHNYTR